MSLSNQTLSASGDSVFPTVLIVDDFDDFRFMLKLKLELSNYKVLEATNGQEAVEMAQRERPTLVLMDICLPVLDGFAATRAIREEPALRDLPIIALTAYGTAEQRIKAAAAGCNDFLTKPLSFERLEESIARLLNGRTGASA